MTKRHRRNALRQEANRLDTREADLYLNYSNPRRSIASDQQ